MSDSKRLVQTVINCLDLETAKEIARKAVEFGTDMLGVGTSLMYGAGLINAIPAIKEIAGDLPVVADVKVHDGGNFFTRKALEYGAQYCTVSTRKNYGCARQAVIAYHDTGIKIIGDLCNVPLDEIPHHVAELQNIGVQSVCVHYTYDESLYHDMFWRCFDGVKGAKGVARIPVGCVVRALSDIEPALTDGADWLALSGDVVNKGAFDGYETMKKCIEAVHRFTGCGASGVPSGTSAYRL